MAKLVKRKTMRIFILLYLCISLILGLVVTTLYINRIQEDYNSYLASLENDTDRIMNYFNQSFIAAVNNCNSIFSSTWYIHYRNIAQIYSDEFHAVKKRDIINELNTKVTALPYVSDILVIIPPLPGDVICKTGWFSFENYKTISGMVTIDLTETMETLPVVYPVIQPASESISVITLQDPNLRKAQGVIAILIDKNKVASTMKGILPEHSVYVHAELCGQTLYETGRFSNDLVINTSSINMPQFSIMVASSTYRNSLLKTQITSYILVMVVVLLASALFSGFFTVFILKPLARIIKKYGGNFRQMQDPYCFISDYMENYTLKNRQLSLEKEHLNQSLERFHSIMRNEIFFGMLTNPHFDFHNECTSSSIPWINEGYPYILVLLEPKHRGSTELPDSLSLEDLSSSILHFCTFSILFNDLCILFWFRNTDIARKQKPLIQERLVQIADGSFLLSISEVLQDPKTMVESYLKQKSEIFIRKKDQLELPLLFQIELVSKLQESNPLECIAFLNESKQSVDPGALMELLSRVAMKYDTGLQPMLDQFDYYEKGDQKGAQWRVVLSFTAKLCKSIQSAKHATEDESAEIICRYIEENYCNPALSMQGLADHFFMHRTLISKILKAKLGVTFSDHLLELRIKKAMTLLNSTRMSIAEIGRKVGYENYITFKRAFFRYNNLSPREFRAKLEDDKLMEKNSTISS